jgi:hypothetical protein
VNSSISDFPSVKSASYRQTKCLDRDSSGPA